MTYKDYKLKMFMLLNVKMDTNYIYTIDNGEATLIRYMGDKSNIKVPSKIGGCPVRYIASSCYDYLDFIESVKIPNSVIEIQ